MLKEGTISVSSSWDAEGSLERAPESSGPSTTCTVEEHPDRLYHRLVWKQHRWQPQGSAKGRANCPPHCWRWASLPPGYLTQAVYKESPEGLSKTPATRPTDCSLCCPQGDVSAASDPALADEGQLFPSGYQANEQSQITHLHHTPTHTTCHALHFTHRSTGLHAHTALITTYHWTPYNAHPRHCICIICCTFAHLPAAQPTNLLLIYNLLHLTLLLCVDYIMYRYCT